MAKDLVINNVKIKATEADRKFHRVISIVNFVVSFLLLNIMFI